MGTFIRSTVGVRRDYAKLTITTGIEVKSASAGFTQYYKDRAFSPDHSITPLVLTPTVTAKAADITPEQVWTVGNSATDGGTAWKVNGEAISSVWTEGTDYELEDGGKTLYVYKNIPCGSAASLSCGVLVYDGRTGLTIATETDPFTLSTVAVTASPMRLSVDCDNVLWCPEADDLWEWEYRDARGLTQKMTETEAANDSCYRKTVNFCVTKGGGQLSEGYGIWINDSSDDTVAYITDSGTLVNNEPTKILELTTKGVTFDCRTIKDELFKVYALDEDAAIIKHTLETIHVKTTHRTYDLPEPDNHSDYTVKQAKYRNSLRVRINGEEAEHPECWLKILWRTLANTANATEQDVGEGDTCVFDPNGAGDGTTATDNGFQMIADTDYHEALSPAVDDSGDFWTDENDNVLLI